MRKEGRESEKRGNNEGYVKVRKLEGREGEKGRGRKERGRKESEKYRKIMKERIRRTRK